MHMNSKNPCNIPSTDRYIPELLWREEFYKPNKEHDNLSINTDQVKLLMTRTRIGDIMRSANVNM